MVEASSHAGRSSPRSVSTDSHPFSWSDPRFSFLNDNKENEQPRHVENQNIVTQTAPLYDRGQKRSTIDERPILERTSSSLPLGKPNEASIPARPSHTGRWTLDDPILDRKDRSPPRAEMEDLTRTISGLQMIMNHTSVRLDALSDKQQAFTESFEKLKAAVDIKTSPSLANRQASESSNLPTPQSVDNDPTSVPSAASGQPYQASEARRLKRLSWASGDRNHRRSMDIQTNQYDLRPIRSAVERSNEQMQHLSQRQRLKAERVADLTSTTEMSQPDVADLPARVVKGSDSNFTLAMMERLQAVADGHHVNMTDLVSDSKSVNTPGQKQQALTEQVSADLESLREKLEALEASSLLEADLLRRNRERDESRMHALQTTLEEIKKSIMQNCGRVSNKKSEKSSAKLEAQLSRLQAENAHQQQTMLSMCSKMMEMMQTQQRRMDKLVWCNHDVAPPPRKMNRKVVGYVYSREL